LIYFLTKTGSLLKLSKTKLFDIQFITTSRFLLRSGYTINHKMKHIHISITFVFLLSSSIFSQVKETKTIVEDTIKGKKMEEVLVTSSRTNSRIENIPTRVEVLGLEDLQEENGVKPGNILSLLGDVAGIQMQQVSASSGNTFARIQGLNGRYTQLLKDGMPLFGGLSGSFGILQIPPMDLKQIEIIKGSASTLYGGDAIGGIINLISKNPGFEEDFSLSLNQSSLSETNFNGYYAKRNNKIGFTLFGGQTYQNQVDVDNDGLTDVASVVSTVIHPKVIFYFSPKATFTINYAGTFDIRKGGDNNYFTNFNNSLYHVATSSQRNNADAKFLYNFSETNNLTIKASSSFLSQKLDTKDYIFNANQNIFYSEASYFYKTEKMNWVAGINLNADIFKNKSIALLNVEDYNFSTFGTFVQNTYKPNQKLTLETGFRYDFNSKFGNFLLPRLSVLYKFNSIYSARINGGFGYKAPNVLSFIDIETDLQKINSNANLKAELSQGFNADINFKKTFENGIEITLNESAFYTKIKNPIFDNSINSNQILLENANNSIVTKGFQSYMRLQYDELELYLGYVFTDVKKEYDLINQNLIVTPKHNISTTFFYEPSESWRFGIEASFIANQLDQNYKPTKDYLLSAGMIQYNMQKFTFVLNAENLFNFKQSNYGKIFSGTISNPIFDKLWAPIDGRVVNLSMKYSI
jgi:outer membrane receptor for ferrienterochelin and colicins